MSSENSIYTRLYFLKIKSLKITPLSGHVLNLGEHGASFIFISDYVQWNFVFSLVMLLLQAVFGSIVLKLEMIK